MKKTLSHTKILGAILHKDFRLYARNKVYLFLTVLSLVFFVLIFWVIPDTVDETINLAISPSLETMIEEAEEALRRLGVPEEQLAQLTRAELAAEEEGLTLLELENETQLRSVIEGTLEVYQTKDDGLLLHDPLSGDKKPADAKRLRVDIGISFPGSFILDVAGDQKTTVTIFSDAAVPEELRGGMQSFVRELAYQLAGRELPVELPEEETIILGVDRSGEQITLREKLRPMMALFILLVETFAMASLVSIEVLQRTVTALVVTPMKVWHFLAAKTIFGTGLALSQGLLILALIGAFTPENWSLLLVTMLIGAVLFTAVAMLIGAAGKDFIGQLMYSMLFTVPLMIPTFTVLFPGTAATWIKVIPSYPLIDLLVGATIYEACWTDSFGALAYALLWVAIIYGVALFVLKRKVESL